MLIMASCSIKKYIPEGEFLSVEAEIKLEVDTTIQNKSELEYELKQVLRPRPNSKFLGGYLGLYFYYKNQKEKPGFFNKYMYKKIGETPVYQSQVKTSEIHELLKNRLENRGFFFSRISSSFEITEKKKISKTIYTINLSNPYLLSDYQLDSMPEPLYSEVKEIIKSSPFNKGQRFDLKQMKTERTRIDAQLKKRGYYNFNEGFLIFEADTNRHIAKQFDLFLGLKKNVPAKSVIPYKISDIYVHPNVELGGDSMSMDTIQYKGLKFIGDEQFFKPEHLEPFITLASGQFYDAQTSKNTSRRLSTIGVYKFVNIQYEEIERIDSAKVGFLKVDIFLSPLTKRGVRAELQAVSKSNNFAGPALSLTYTNRNLFQGGELLNTSANGGYEFQIGNDNELGYNATIGVKNELVIPRVIFPIRINTDFFLHDIPKTKTSISLDYSNRSSLYTLVSATAEFGYDWNAAKYVEHRINPISLNYTRLTNSTATFEGILDENPFLAQSFEQQFIGGLNYSFIYNELINTSKTYAVYFNSNFELAGNIFSALAPAAEEGELQSLFGQEFAQYTKLDLEFRSHYKVRSEHVVATRLFAGYGLPYGNSSVMPFSKQYFSGGPYGIRAFRIRSLGPGTYDSTEDNSQSFFEQTGNIRLEGNVEYRFPIISYLKGAVFMDVGNIWNSKSNSNLEGGQFTSEFYNQLGMGTGVGLRVDVQGFVIRFDFATPFHTPSMPIGDRLKLELDETKFNFAIGYPF